MAIDSSSKSYYERPDVVQGLLQMNHHWVWPEEETDFQYIQGVHQREISAGYRVRRRKTHTDSIESID